MPESVTIHRQLVRPGAQLGSAPGFLSMVKDLELRPVYDWMTATLAKDYTTEIRRNAAGIDTVIVCDDPHDAIILQITHGISNAVL